MIFLISHDKIYLVPLTNFTDERNFFIILNRYSLNKLGKIDNLAIILIASLRFYNECGKS